MTGELLEEAGAVIAAFRRLKISSPVKREQQHILEMQHRADRVAAKLRAAVDARRPATNPKTLAELDRMV